MTDLSPEEKERRNRVMNLKRGYPWNWHIISRQEKDRAGWRCEHCRVGFDPETGRALDGSKRQLNVHHLNGARRDCRHENLLVCCSGCHPKIEKWRPGDLLLWSWDEAPAWMVERGLAYQVRQRR